MKLADIVDGMNEVLINTVVVNSINALKTRGPKDYAIEQEALTRAFDKSVGNLDSVVHRLSGEERVVTVRCSAHRAYHKKRPPPTAGSAK